jgi:hypothetical protein
MSFAPIKLRDYVRKHVKNNPGTNEREYTARLEAALAAYKAGAVCSNCGQPIWVIGSAEVGHMCFTCITGEADPSEDYEIAEACHKRSVPHTPPEPSPDEVSPDSDVDDRDVPF